MTVHTADHRFAVQRTPYERWHEATEANLAADFLGGYDLWTSAYTSGREEWRTLEELLRTLPRAELKQFVAERRHRSLVFLVMMLTGACNADCPVCFTDRLRKRGETTPEQRDAVLHQAAALGAKYVYVPGEGEPTIDRGWWQFLESCRNAGLHAVVFTNGLIFSDAATSRKFWGCEPEQAVDRLLDYPVSLYSKMWSTDPHLVGEMMGIDAGKYRFVEHAGLSMPHGMAQLMERFPRDRLGIEVMIERRNADEVADTIVPFADDHGLSRIVEVIQHNGRILGNHSYDPTPSQLDRVASLLSPTSCTVATCKAVVTSRGYLSPRIAILENQLPPGASHVADGNLWDLLHGADYIVQRRYERACLCETEPESRAHGGDVRLAGPRNTTATDLRRAAPLSGPDYGPDHGPDYGPDDAGAAARPAAGPAAPSPTATVAELAASEVAHGTEVRVVGRCRPVGPGLFQLTDGPDGVLVAGDAAAHTWVQVAGTWDAIDCALRASAVRILTEPARSPFGPLPEFATIRDETGLRAITDFARLRKLARAHLDDAGYLEVSTPTLTAFGEMAHIDQATTEPIMGRRFHLRTDPEEYLKRYLTAGLPAVYEISTNVRCDASDETHLVEFRSLEYYRRFLRFDEAIAVTDELLASLAAAWPRGSEVLARRPGRMRFAELFASVTGVDLLAPECTSAAGLRDALRTSGHPVEVPDGLADWRRSYLTGAFDVYLAPRIRQPLWVTHYPADLGLSAALDPDDDRVALRAELFVAGGLELAHVYENLVVPDQLRVRYDRRRAHRVAAGMSHVPTNEPLMMSAEAGMPPMSGGAIGLDRVLMVLRGDPMVGAGVLFPREGLARVPEPSAAGCGGRAAADGCTGSCGTCGSGSCH